MTEHPKDVNNQRRDRLTIEITPKMIEAGRAELAAGGGFVTETEAVVSIFKRMLKASEVSQ